MKTKVNWFVILLLYIPLMTLNAQSNSKRWKEVEKAEQEGLPQTAVRHLDEIFREAQQHQRAGEMLKAYTYRTMLRQRVDPDSVYVDLKGLEEWAATAGKPEDRAILHTLLACKYSDYASSNYWALQQRTEVDEAPAADLREWSKNMFVQQVVQHANAALAQPELLLSLTAKAYTPFVVEREWSRYYQHNMYQLLATYNLSALQNIQRMDTSTAVDDAIAGIYAALRHAYHAQQNKDAQLLLALDELNWHITLDKLPVDRQLATLDTLIEQYHSRELCAELYLKKAQLLHGQDRKVEALKWCDTAIARYSKYARINTLRTLKEDILRPVLVINADGAAYPGDTITAKVSHANIKGFTVHLHKVNLPATSSLLNSGLGDEFYKKHTKRVSTQHITLVPSDSYLVQDTLLKLPAPQDGIYVMEVVPDVAFDRLMGQLIYVSPLKLLTRKLPNELFEAVVLNSMSGKPVPNARVHLFTYDKGDVKQMQTFTTGDDGRTEFAWDKAYMYVTAEVDGNFFCTPQRIRGAYSNFTDDEEEQLWVTLLTDRSIYRPGQTVYVKGVAYNQTKGVGEVAANESIELILMDATYDEMDDQDVITNEFGSFTTTFVLPADAPNGIYQLRSQEGKTVFRVEEYKRPTFDIAFEKPEGSYQLGDVVTLKGAVNTYSGIPVQEVPVQYTVDRQLRGWWFPYYGTPTLIDSGSAMLSKDGTFALPVLLQPDKAQKADEGFYTYTVSATVTSVSGETQTTTTTLSAGSRSLLLNVGLPERLNKDGDMTLMFSATNLSEQRISVEGEYRLYPYTDYTHRIAAKEAVHTGTFTSNVPTEMTAWRTIPSGAYKLVLSAKDEQGREATFETETVLFSIHDTRPVVDTPIWYYAVNDSMDVATPGEFILGTSKKDAYLLMDVFSGSTRIEKRVLHLSDTIVHFTYPYREEYGDALRFTFGLVKGGQYYWHQADMHKTPEDRALQLTWSSFRDKLLPGEQEEWTLTIKHPQGTAADAEMLATMYDASLDKLWKYHQEWGIRYYPSLPMVNWNLYSVRGAYYSFWFRTKTWRYPAMTFDSFWMDSEKARLQMMVSYSSELNESVVVGYGSVKDEMMVRGLGSKRAKLAGAPADMIADDATYEATEETGAAVTLEEAGTELRTNFAETAFFYPQLRTNEHGEVVIAFTMPHSLTRWKFNGYAHTKDMMTGKISGEVVTSKEFMLTPNLPRFVRVGDKSAVAASVANLTAGKVSGTVVLTLFDPLTEKVITTQKQKFAVEAGSTVGVNFMFTATDKYDLLGCRIVAQGGAFSDGEQHLLPVLSHKERIIETVAMPIRGEQTREFTLDHLFNNHSKTADNRRMTVEFSGNPAWYAIQALPSLSLPTHDDAISWATAYYANALAGHIAQTQPRIKSVFDAWKAQGGTKDAFMSNLQKNQEVKQLLIEESPWLLEATTEQERMERIATLFDLNNIQYGSQTALNKLKELQLNDGSWAWCKGMSGSRYITQFVTQLLVRLQLLTSDALTGEALAMQQAAFRFLHEEALHEHQRIVESEKRGNNYKGISGDALNYLYLIALSDEKVPPQNKAAHTYFLAKVKELLPTQQVIEKSLAAVILQHAGRPAEAQAFIASLKEYTTHTDEQGMYFAFNEDPYSWKGLKVPAHVSVMEAFDMVGNDPAAVEEMKLWLLKQKQTQQWNSPVATANAVYALLYRGSNPLDNQGDVRVTLGQHVIETLRPAASSIPGMAYVQETITDKATLAKVKKVVVEKHDPGIAWGAVYAEYQEEIDKVTAYGEGLHVEKKLYVEQVSGDKKTLVPLASGAKLSVGDKVVSRITIKLDRTMDFVQLKDQRGACFEPIGVLSGYTWNGGVGYYVSVKDASTNFFFDALSKGTYVLEYGYRVSRTGVYEGGLARIQSAYAPEYAAHSASTKVNVE